MVLKFFDDNYDDLISLPASISGRWHSGETIAEHLLRVVKFADGFITNLGLNQFESDILIAGCLLHDIWNSKGTSKDRNKNEYQKEYENGYNRSRESAQYHPMLGSFMIGKYMLDNNLMNTTIIKTAEIIQTHMSHWSKEWCPTPTSKLAEYLCMCDFFGSRRNITIS
jgi:response regulator RpfG family c-di-GMP phosphodiesterase